VIDAVAAIAEALRPHLVEEETVVLRLATMWITPEEWGPTGWSQHDELWR
jgi:hypothetical protein